MTGSPETDIVLSTCTVLSIQAELAEILHYTMVQYIFDKEIVISFV